MMLDFTKDIQVRSADGKWWDAKPLNVKLEESLVGEDGHRQLVYGMSAKFSFANGTYEISDVFGWGSDNWRYKEKCCEQCAFCSKEGGDLVPYGDTMVPLPEGYICDCPDMPEDVEYPYEHTKRGTECTYHKFGGEML